ncbi:MAG: hypothetical protein CBC35_09890 [Planctomycetes bacterium TMED75]|nr:hypothetical protein [Planctomycetaceae bacterium]OUU91271.1 MAG: hypothetical protein CBC35_09890 [Planctomycetes bacterium TMED75]
MKYTLMLLVFLVGMCQPFQAGMNARMNQILGDRFQAGFINGFVNLLIMLLVLLVLFRGLPSLSAMKEAPWWAYLAGVIGASIVVVQLSSAPVLGAGLLIAFFVAGQVSGSLLVDGFGLVGYVQRTPSVLRILGLGFIVLGVVLAVLAKDSGVSPPTPATLEADES